MKKSSHVETNGKSEWDYGTSLQVEMSEVELDDKRTITKQKRWQCAMIATEHASFADPKSRENFISPSRSPMVPTSFTFRGDFRS